MAHGADPMRITKKKGRDGGRLGGENSKRSAAEDCRRGAETPKKKKAESKKFSERGDIY